MPKQYAAQAKISDEPKETDLLIGLNDMTAWINKGSIPNANKDGINSPEVYSKILYSQDFIIDISKTQIKKYQSCLFDYIKTYYKPTLLKKFISLVSEDKNNEALNIYESIRNNIQYSITPFNHTITIQYSDTDPIVAYTITNAIIEQLQRKVTSQKQSHLIQNFKDATVQRKQIGIKCHQLQRQYADYVDKNTDATLSNITTYISQLRTQRDEMFETYQKACVQEQRYRFLSSKENYPFSVLQSPFIPIEPIAPKPFPYFFTFLSIGIVLATWRALFLEKRESVNRNKIQ